MVEGMDELGFYALAGAPQSPAELAAVRSQFDLGADAVILHGATPTELAPVVDAYRAAR